MAGRWTSPDSPIFYVFDNNGTLTTESPHTGKRTCQYDIKNGKFDSGGGIYSISFRGDNEFTICDNNTGKYYKYYRK
jgi:hypothetical protein